LLLSDLALVLQYVSGPSSDFLAKILGVDTPLFLCNTQFCFPLSSLLFCKSSKRIASSVYHRSSVGSLYAYGAVDPGLVPKYAVFFLITRSVMAVKTVKWHLFFYFLSSFFFTFVNERSAVDFQCVMIEIKLLLCNTFSDCLS
jgi:hypothetical protein